MDKWIPITQKLPDRDGWYLTVVDLADRRLCLRGYYDSYDKRFEEGDIVTHWMPLPELPKSNTEE